MGIFRIVGVDEIVVVVGSSAVVVGTRVPYTVGTECCGILQYPFTIHLDVGKVVDLRVLTAVRNADILLDDNLLVVALCHRDAVQC